MDVKSKILEYIEYKQISRNSVERTLGWSKSAIYNAANMRVDKLSEFVQTYEDISLDWLLRDEGSMIREIGTNNEDDLSRKCEIKRKKKGVNTLMSVSESAIEDLDPHFVEIIVSTAKLYNTSITEYERRIREYEDRIKKLEAENEMLKGKISEKQTI